MSNEKTKKEWMREWNEESLDRWFETSEEALERALREVKRLRERVKENETRAFKASVVSEAVSRVAQVPSQCQLGVAVDTLAKFED